MLKHYNDDDLRQKGIAEKYFFFIQLWKELTERKTLNTYQYRIMNVFSILQELNRYIDLRLNRMHSTNSNIRACINEAKTIVRRDSVLKKESPSVYRRLSEHLNTKIETDEDLRRLHYQISYCYKEFSPEYINKLLVLLKMAIDQNNYQEMLNLTNNLISISVMNNWSIIELSKIVDEFNDSIDNPDEAWKKFVASLMNHEPHLYTVCIPIKVRSALLTRHSTAPIEEFYKDITINGIKTYNGNHLSQVENYIFSFAKQTKYAVINVTSYDYYAASRQALERYSEVLNLMSFYSIIKPWDLSDVNWVVINEDNLEYRQMSLTDLDNAYAYIDGVTKIYKAAKLVEQSSNDDIKKKLHAVYSYVNMGKASYNLTSRFINTWVALESLCRPTMYSNIIDNVLENVPAALCIRYMYKLYRNFIDDCFRCKIDLTEFDIQRGKYQSKGKKVRQIIMTLTSEKEYAKLYEKCSQNQLLAYRCNELRDFLINPKLMYEKIMRHYFNVKEQLSRLYEIRNELAHSAAADSDIPNLMKCMEHLNDYLSSFVAEILYCLSKKENASIELEEVFEIIKNNYADFQNIVTSKKKLQMDDTLKELFQTGIIKLIG